MTPQISEGTMRLIRARARIANAYAVLDTRLEVDAVGWERMNDRLQALEFDPVMDDELMESDRTHLQETLRLAASLLALQHRLQGHLAAYFGG